MQDEFLDKQKPPDYDILMKKILFAILMSAFALGYASAQAPGGGEVKTFTITAYYSPLPGQSHYVTGSYAGDVYLNGEGIQGADGTAVGKGMLAAPRTIPFKTPVYVPGYGMGIVHDRGGAIVEKGERSLAVETRLDLWMGFGEEALREAVAWGVRTLDCTIYPVGSHGTVQASAHPFPTTKTFIVDMKEGSQGEHVRRLQEYLGQVGFMSATPTSYYGPKTKQAVLMYQLYHGLTRSQTDIGAGDVGTLTRVFLNAEIKERLFLQASGGRVPPYIYTKKLSAGAYGEEVRRLQAVLTAEGYFNRDITPRFGDATKDALIAFQLAEGIITDGEAGGHVGPNTLKVLNNRYTPARKAVDPVDLSFEQDIIELKEITVENMVPTLTFEQNPLYGDSLSNGSRGDRVQLLQRILKEEGYFVAEPNGNFATQTRNALIAYQMSRQIITKPSDTGAGVFGPSTQAQFKTEFGG